MRAHTYSNKLVIYSTIIIIQTYKLCKLVLANILRWLHLHLDYRLPDRQEAATKARQTCHGVFFFPYSSICTLLQYYNCIWSHQSIDLWTILIVLISNSDKFSCRYETDHLVTWCGQNNRVLHALKTVEMLVDFQKEPRTRHQKNSFFLTAVGVINKTKVPTLAHTLNP